MTEEKYKDLYLDQKLKNIEQKLDLHMQILSQKIDLFTDQALVAKHDTEKKLGEIEKNIDVLDKETALIRVLTKYPVLAKAFFVGYTVLTAVQLYHLIKNYIK